MSALLAGLLSGVIGAMGMGGGAVLIIYLTLFAGVEQIAAQGINLIFFIPIGLTAVLIYSKKKQIKWKITIPIALGGIIGSLVGLRITGLLGSDLLSKIFGGLLCLLGIFEIFRKSHK
ncbi:MAG: sulfite exporter TauE/SafE family protein [Clostridia bacterium]|nr:sulfite exporter TauE/SafE family protein [Clostridia bacterium]